MLYAYQKELIQIGTDLKFLVCWDDGNFKEHMVNQHICVVLLLDAHLVVSCKWW